MAWSVDNLERDELVVHQSGVGVQLLVDVVVGTDKSFGDESDHHRWNWTHEWVE